MWLEFAKIKGAKIILHAKSSTFRAAKLKGFTVNLFIQSRIAVGESPLMAVKSWRKQNGRMYFSTNSENPPAV